MIGNRVNIQLENWSAGKYKVTVVNVLDQKVAEKEIINNGIIGNYALIVDNPISSGNYRIIIRNETGYSVYQLSLIHISEPTRPY